jgi:two-component system phosphate regulon sensor histidine kinase PhoR
MKRKIFYYYIVLIVIAITITGFFVFELASSVYSDEVESRLTSTANLIQYEITDEISKGNTIDYNQAAKKYSTMLNLSFKSENNPKKAETRITFIDFNGKVLGESEADYKSMENHLSRKEVVQAKEGKVGKDIRRSITLNIDFLYIAVPIKSANAIIRVSTPLVQVKHIKTVILYYTLIGILSGLVLTILLALKFSSNLAKPINELISASKIISSGDYSKRINIDSKNELNQLTTTFNQMAGKLEKNMSEMMDKNIKVDSIINSMTSGIVAVDNNYRIILINSIACELFNVENGPGLIGMNLLELIRNNQINSYLKETMEKNISMVNDIIISAPENKVLRIYTNPIKSKDFGSPNSGGIASNQDITAIKKLEQIRTDFVSNVTHELKTPLTSIRGFIETLRGGAINDPEVSDKFLEIIDIEAERLFVLINDILQLSEIENKQQDTNIKSYRLMPIVEETISILAGTAAKKEITLINEMDEGLKIVANKDRIKQMLINLIDNGIKYSKNGGSVTVKGTREGQRVIISVKDTGIGISKSDIPRIFERFYRVDKGRSRSMGGTGLGLSIVKHIVNLYNGDIKVISEPGKGSEFIIKIPD